jgi:hypothetical protein
MKKLVAFAMILSLGLFCAIGCQAKKAEKPAAKPAVTKEEPKVGGEAAAKEEPKPADTK